MYKIQTNTGEVIITEKPNFGANVSEFDAADELTESAE